MVEPGWNCTGGSAQSRDICTRIAPQLGQKTLALTPNRLTHTNGVMSLGLSLNELPPEIAANNCQYCPWLLTTSVYRTNQTPSINVSFTAPRNITVTYNFGAEPIDSFQATIEFNKEFARYLLPNYNTSQVINFMIDPRLYAITG